MQPVLQPALYSENLNSLSPNKLRKKYQKDIDFINKVGEKKLKHSKTKISLTDCLEAIRCFNEIKIIDQEFKQRGRRLSKRDSITELEKTILKIASNFHLQIAVKNEITTLDLGLFSNEQLEKDIEKHFQEPIFKKVKVETVSFPKYVDDSYENVLAKKICLKTRDQETSAKVFSFFCSLIRPDAMLNEDYRFISYLSEYLKNAEKDFALSDIEIIMSYKGGQCKVRLGDYMIITNSDTLSPENCQKLCCVDHEAIEEILKANDPSSQTSDIPVLRGHDVMGMKIAEYLGLKEVQ